FDLSGRQKDDLTSIQTKFIHKFDNNYKLRTGLKVSHHALEYIWSSGSSLNSKQISTIYALIENPTNKRLHIQAGLENQYDRIYNSTFEAKNMGTGFLGDLHLRINKDFSLLSSMRYDINSDQDNTFSIKGGIIAKLPGKINLKANISTSIKNPTINDLYYPEDSYGNVGNPDLVSEKGIYTDIILSRKFGKNFQIKTAFFYYEIKDMIIWDDNIALGKRQPVNKDNVKIGGLELTAALSLDPVALKLAYTYNPTELVNDGKAGLSRLPYTPLHKVNASADIKISKAVISTSIDYMDVYYTSTANSTKLSDVFLLNMGVNLYLSETYRMGAAFNNILNKNYQFFEGYPMPGFNFKVYVKMEM
ncbi:MAG: TonB-dependent receptor, partial [Spirochaetes bacterium]|nr:TonB-dependent receptor [Spirochaetota bacterium]